jgi:acyl transferase domain-containing protein
MPGKTGGTIAGGYSKGEFYGQDLSDLAYTLQVGRDAMEERIAMVVSSINELQEKLRGFLEERDDIESLYKGQLRRNKDMLSVLEDEDMGFYC